MLYIMSDIHASANAYFEMKNRIGLRANDMLIIIGDVLDGNCRNPEEGLKILDDIMLNDNIQLILGDHEYAHIMYHVTEDDEEVHELWEKQICNPNFQGQFLLQYMMEHLTERERKRYIDFLISCEMSELINIGKRYFYLIHGSPIVCRKGDIYSWQREIAITPIDLDKNYFMAISHDPDIQLPEDLTNKNLITISGHVHTKYYFEQYPFLMQNQYKDISLPTEENPKMQKAIFYNKKFLLDCGCSGNGIGNQKDGWQNNLSCLAMDSAGFYIEYLINTEGKNDRS